MTPGCDRPASSSVAATPALALFDPAVPRLSDAGRLRASLIPAPKPIPLNRLHTWRLHVETPDGAPVTGADVTLSGGMPEHSHGLPTRPQVSPGPAPGGYLIEGIRFQMPGWWQLRANIGWSGGRDTVVFDLMVR
jgi:hypothetical protein